MFRFNLLLFTVLISYSVAFAIPNGAIDLDDSELSAVDDIICGFISDKWLPGRMINNLYFLSLPAEIRNITQNWKNASGNRKNKLNNKRNRLKIKLRQQRNICLTLPYPSTEQPDGFFANNGDVTELGRIEFQIPEGIVGNVSRGLSAWNSNCSGCHSESERRNRSFSQYRILTGLSPMSFDTQSLSNPDLADITAYLNRFR